MDICSIVSWLSQGWMSGKTRATPQRNGYGRYFRFMGVTGDLFLCVNFCLWAASGETPSWHLPGAARDGPTWRQRGAYQTAGGCNGPKHTKSGRPDAAVK